MKKLLTIGHTLVVPLLLLGTWAGSHAQSLGTPSASVWIGRPLEMTVPTRFASADSRDECVQADVFFGDTRLPPERVRATIIGAGPGPKRVRIETESLIDEPVVTVSVRAGCHNSVTRSYTLLSELPSDQVVAALTAQRPRATLPTAPLSPAMAAAAAMAPLQLTAATETSAVTRTSAAASPRVRPVRTAGTAVAAASPLKTRPARRAAAQATPAPAATGSRLRLEPLDLDSQALLRVSTRLAEPAGDATRRATAAMLWQAINADPQEVLRTTVMLQNLERDLASLRQASSQTRAEMAALRQRLDAAQPWYGSIAALQLLALMLLAGAATAGVLWYRTRRSEPEHWYAQPPGLPAEPALAPQPADESFAQADPAVAEPEAQAQVEPLPPVIMAAAPDLPEADLPALAAVLAGREPDAPPPAEPLPGPSFAFDAPVPQPATTAQRRGADGVMRVETLAATFEELEFLASLGLTSDAADVLKSYLQGSGSPAPLAFYELMRLCERQEDPGRAAAVRRRYAQVFGLEAPRLEQLTAPLGLDSMTTLCARITSLWNTPQVLQVIEDALFAVPAPAAPLTLQAGRDLLCLHDVAMSLLTDPSSSPGIGDGHGLAPWAQAEDAAGAQLAVQAVADVDRGGALGVDIDLAAAPPDPLPARRVDDTALIAEMHAAARAAEERIAALRRQEEQEDAFSAAVASERMPLGRH